jgi:hypothetical protein
MQEQLLALWAKVVENKQTVIKAAGTVAGALLGALVASVIVNNQQEEVEVIGWENEADAEQ